MFNINWSFRDEDGVVFFEPPEFTHAYYIYPPFYNHYTEDFFNLAIVNIYNHDDVLELSFESLDDARLHASSFFNSIINKYS